MNNEFIEAGKIVSTHALKGEVKLEPWCDSAEFLLDFKRLYFEDMTEIKPQQMRVHKNMLILKMAGVDSVEAANEFRGKLLYFKKSDIKLPENTYFVKDLIGLRVIDADDSSVFYGVINDVFFTGANDVYQIKNGEKEYLIPAIKQVVIKTDIENGVLIIRPIKGLFDDED